VFPINYVKAGFKVFKKPAFSSSSQSGIRLLGALQLYILLHKSLKQALRNQEYLSMTSAFEVFSTIVFDLGEHSSVISFSPTQSGQASTSLDLYPTKAS
jgi:hypothetical protein